MRKIVVFTLLVMSISQPRCWAQSIADNAALADRFMIGIGGFYPTSSTTLRLDRPDGGVGTSIDFERTLGLDDKKLVFDATGRWRFTERWRVEAEYFALNRSGTRTTDRQINWGSQIFPSNVQLNSSLDFSDTRISVGYSFFKTEDKEVGASLGAHVAKYDAGVDSPQLQERQGAKVTAPLPVLSLYGEFALTRAWAVGVRLDRFALSYGDYDGNITAVNLDVQWEIFRHFIVLGGYRNFFVKLDANKDKWHGRIDQSYQGPILQLQASFR